MFGNHPLPNIAPSLLCFSPPPTHIPPPLPSPLPLANARTGQARARSSPNPVCAPPLVEGCGRTTRHVTTPAASRTATSDPQPPRHHRKRPRTPRHSRVQPQPTIPASENSTHATSRMTTTPTPAYPPLPAPKTTNGEREEERRMGNGARTQGKGGMRTQRTRQGKGEAVRAPSFRFLHPRSQRGGVKTTRRFVRARLSPPNSIVGGNFYSTGGSVIPHAAPVSFRTGWRIHAAPLSFRFKRGGVFTLPRFVLNGGGVFTLPRFVLFCFEWGGVFTPPPFCFVSNGVA